MGCGWGAQVRWKDWAQRDTEDRWSVTVQVEKLPPDRKWTGWQDDVCKDSGVGEGPFMGLNSSSRNWNTDLRVPLRRGKTLCKGVVVGGGLLNYWEVPLVAREEGLEVRLQAGLKVEAVKEGLPRREGRMALGSRDLLSNEKALTRERRGVAGLSDRDQGTEEDSVQSRPPGTLRSRLIGRQGCE